MQSTRPDYQFEIEFVKYFYNLMSSLSSTQQEYMRVEMRFLFNADGQQLNDEKLGEKIADVRHFIGLRFISLAKQNDIPVIQKLFGEHLSSYIDYRDNDGWSALDFSCASGNLEMTQFLVQNGCKLDAETDLKKPIERAISSECMSVVEYLLKIEEERALTEPLPCQSVYGGYPYLARAYESRSVDMINLIKVKIKAVSANPKFKNSLFASMLGTEDHPAVIDIQRQILDGKIYLALSGFGAEDEVLRYLEEGKLRVSGGDKFGDTLLHSANRKNNEITVQLLLLFGARTGLVDTGNQIPIEKYRKDLQEHYYGYCFLWSYVHLALSDCLKRKRTIWLSEQNAKKYSHILNNCIIQFDLVVYITKEKVKDVEMLYAENKTVYRVILGQRSEQASCLAALDAMIKSLLSKPEHEQRVTNAFLKQLHQLIDSVNKASLKSVHNRSNANLIALGDDIVNYDFINADLSKCIFSLDALLKVKSLFGAYISSQSFIDNHFSEACVSRVKQKIVDDYKKSIMQSNTTGVLLLLTNLHRSERCILRLAKPYLKSNKFRDTNSYLEVIYAGQKRLLELASVDNFELPIADGTHFSLMLNDLFQNNLLIDKSMRKKHHIRSVVSEAEKDPVAYITRSEIIRNIQEILLSCFNKNTQSITNSPEIIGKIRNVLGGNMIKAGNLMQLSGVSKQIILQAILKIEVDIQILYLVDCLNANTPLGSIFCKKGFLNFTSSGQYLPEINARLSLLRGDVKPLDDDSDFVILESEGANLAAEATSGGDFPSLAPRAMFYTPENKPQLSNPQCYEFENDYGL